MHVKWPFKSEYTIRNGIQDIPSVEINKIQKLVCPINTKLLSIIKYTKQDSLSKLPDNSLASLLS